MSRNYYNEFNKEKAEWLRQLIAVEVLAPGDVDERSILDVRPGDLMGYTQCHFFAGIGIWPFALRAAGWPDSLHVWTGSCPCQPFSAAGKRGGFDDERHLWPAWFQLIAQCRPVDVFGEQVASKDGLDWFDLVHTDLEAAGYAVGATDLCAAGFGAPHIRQRMFFVGHTDAGGLTGQCGGGQGRGTEPGAGGVANNNSAGLPTRESPAVLGAGRGFEGRAVEQRSGAPVRSVADTEHARHDGSPGNAPEQGGHGAADGLPDGSGGVVRGAAGIVADPVQTGRPEWGPSPGLGQVTGGGVTGGHWADADWINCRDGKARPVEPGSFPLAHGAPARVLRLRGYGDGIVAPVAQAFVEAFLTCE